MITTNSNAQESKIPWLQIIPIIVSLLTFFIGGGYFYNNFVNRPILAYTLLENYDLGSQYFSGVVIENRGRQNQTNINFTISNLAFEITSINFPGLHESFNITSGGIGHDAVTIEMPRLSAGRSLSVYLLSSKPINLNASNLLVSSSETVGQPGSEIISIISVTSRIAAVISILSAGFGIWSSASLRATVSKRKEAELDAMQKIFKTIRDVDEVKEGTVDLRKRITMDLKRSTKDLKRRTMDLKKLESEQKEIVNAFNSIQNKIAFASKSIDDLSSIIQQAVESGKIESDDRVERILKLLEHYNKSLQESSKTVEELAQIAKEGPSPQGTNANQ